MQAGASATDGAAGVSASAGHADEIIAGAEASVVSAARRLKSDLPNEGMFPNEGMAELRKAHERVPSYDTRVADIEVKSQMLAWRMRRLRRSGCLASKTLAGMPMPEKVLIFSRFPKALMLRIGERFELLDAAGKPPNQMFPADQLSGVRAMITAGGTPLGGDMMDMMPKLGAIVCYGTGYDGVDLQAARSRRITVGHSPGANAASVADIAVTLMLAATRRLLVADNYVRSGDW